MSRVYDPERPFVMSVDIGPPPAAPGEPPPPRPVALFCSFCSPSCASCPLTVHQE